MEERQLTKLADWFKSQQISCLEILAKGAVGCCGYFCHP